jgi:hypothetical protein
VVQQVPKVQLNQLDLVDLVSPQDLERPEYLEVLRYSADKPKLQLPSGTLLQVFQRFEHTSLHQLQFQSQGFHYLAESLIRLFLWIQLTLMDPEHLVNLGYLEVQSAPEVPRVLEVQQHQQIQLVQSNLVNPAGLWDLLDRRVRHHLYHL